LKPTREMRERLWLDVIGDVWCLADENESVLYYGTEYVAQAIFAAVKDHGEDAIMAAIICAYHRIVDSIGKLAKAVKMNTETLQKIIKRGMK